MNEQDFPEEPLNNIELESAVLGLRMALTPEEEVEAREKFLALLRDSTLAVPSVDPPDASANGAKPGDQQLTLIIAENAEGVKGVPAFTTVACLRATIPHAQSCTFVQGVQLAGMLATSEFKLFIDGPDLHAEVDPTELQEMVATAQQLVEQQQRDALHNVALEDALTALAETNNAETRDAVVAAFLGGFCGIPLAGENDEGRECIVMAGPMQEGQTEPQQLGLITLNQALLCFTGEPMLRQWDAAPRGAIALPGPAIVEMLKQSGISELHLNLSSPIACVLQLDRDRVTVKI